MKKIFAALCTLMLIPMLALANSDMVSISELRQQVEAMGGGRRLMKRMGGQLRWISQYISQMKRNWLYMMLGVYGLY